MEYGYAAVGLTMYDNHLKILAGYEHDLLHGFDFFFVHTLSDSESNLNFLKSVTNCFDQDHYRQTAVQSAKVGRNFRNKSTMLEIKEFFKLK